MRSGCKSVAALIAAVAFSSGASAAPLRPPGPTLDDDYKKVVAPMIASGTWAFFTSCRLATGIKHVLVLPVGGGGGFYGEFLPSGWQQQATNVTVGPTVQIGELMGGEQTARIQTAIIKGMLRSPFQLVEPSQLERVFKSQPVTRACATYKEP